MTLAEWEAAEVEDAPLTVEIDPSEAEVFVAGGPPVDEFVVAMQQSAPEPNISHTKPIGADGPPEESVEITLLDSPEADDEVSIEPAAESLDITLASEPSEADDAPADEKLSLP